MPKQLQINDPHDPSAYWRDLDTIWPIGSVFLAVVSTDPAILTGVGLWQPLAAGALLMTRPGPAVVHSVDSAPSSVHTSTIPTLPIWAWQRVS